MLIYLKSAKTGGTSMVKYLKLNYKKVLYYCYDHQIPSTIDPSTEVIILANLPTIKKFKFLHSSLYQQSTKLVLFRNPYNRVISSYNYLGFNRSLDDVLMDPPTGSYYDPLYIHFTLSQTDSIDITPSDINNDKFYIHNVRMY